MSGVLCIDFGTSSIRAVRRLQGGRLKVLDIGRVVKSRLDDASIRSEIHIDERGETVTYGEHAVEAYRKLRSAALFESSPKLWLKDPQTLHLPIFRKGGLSRASLVSGLLANALRASLDAEGLRPTALGDMEVRVAHPVWPAAVAREANAALKEIVAQAKHMAPERQWLSVTAATLRSCTSDPVPTLPSKVDVVEPIAAAVELLPSDENVRRLCGVVDVGAGTTDIGLFQAVAPDSASSVRGKLYQLGKPKSVFKAGNFIDEIVLELAVSRAKRRGQDAIEDVKSRIRQVKEALFVDGFIHELGADVQIEDLQSHPGARSLAREIRVELESLVNESAAAIIDMLSARTHRVSHLEVAMAGGGAEIDFIKKAIQKPIAVEGKSLPVKVTTAAGTRGIDLFGAGRGRMAVSLGGASLEYDALVHERPEIKMIRLGPM